MSDRLRLTVQIDVHYNLFGSSWAKLEGILREEIVRTMAEGDLTFGTWAAVTDWTYAITPYFPNDEEEDEE